MAAVVSQKLSALPEKDASVRYLVGAFVKHLIEEKSHLLKYLETVVAGTMLSLAVYLLPDATRIEKKFKRTFIYFDTSFLIFALGYAGELRKAPCSELLTLLTGTGAILRCFDHTLDELKGILERCAATLGRAKFPPMVGVSGDTVEYFLSKEFTPSDIILLAERLPEELNKLGVSVVDPPSLTPDVHQFNPDHQKLEASLRQAISFRQEITLERDIESLCSIQIIRRGKSTSYFEECAALFVTTNAKLAQAASSFFNSSAYNEIAPCVTNDILTTYLWLKTETAAPDLPRKRVLADCYAATLPSESLVIKYIAEIDKLKKDERVTAEEYFALRNTFEARSALMDVTMGDEDAFAQGTVPEILEIVRERLSEKARRERDEQKGLRLVAEQREKESIRTALAREDEIKQKAAEREAQLSETIRLNEQENEARRVRIRQNAKKRARVVRVFGILFVTIVYGFAVFTTITWEISKTNSSVVPSSSPSANVSARNVIALSATRSGAKGLKQSPQEKVKDSIVSRLRHLSLSRWVIFVSETIVYLWTVFNAVTGKSLLDIIVKLEKQMANKIEKNELKKFG